MNRALCAALLLISMLALPAQAQSPQDIAPDAAAQTLDFKTLEDRMTVPVEVDGRGPYRFVVDTGSERTVLARDVAESLGLSPGRPVNMISMTGTDVTKTFIIPRLRVAALPERSRIEAPALEAYDLGASGLLGLDSLQDHAIAIDFESASMAVLPSKKRVSLPKSPSEIVVRAKSLLGQLIVTDARVDNIRIRVVIDTGSAITIGNKALRDRLKRKPQDIAQLILHSVTGDQLHVDYTIVSNLHLGEVLLSNMPVAFADAEPFRKFGLDDRPALLLGMDAMRFFRKVSIDFPNRQVRFLLPRQRQFTDVTYAGWRTLKKPAGKTDF